MSQTLRIHETVLTRAKESQDSQLLTQQYTEAKQCLQQGGVVDVVTSLSGNQQELLERITSEEELRTSVYFH